MKKKLKDDSNKEEKVKELSQKIEELMGPPNEAVVVPGDGPTLYKPNFKDDSKQPDINTQKHAPKNEENPPELKSIPSAPPLDSEKPTNPTPLVKEDPQKTEKPDESSDIEKINEEINNLVHDKNKQITPIKTPEDPDKLNNEIKNADEKIDNQVTSKAIDEIVAQEGDEVLEAEDAKLQEAFTPKPEKKRKNFKEFLKNLWKNPKSRKIILLSVFFIILIISIVPTSRYFMLNTLGVRASASLMILDNSTQQPLKNVNVKIGLSEGQTDNEGRVKLNKVKLGNSDLTIEKRAFAEINQKIIIGLGSNPLGEFKIIPVGVQYTFYVKDFLSNLPIQKAEASSNEASAFSDKDGKIVLTVDLTSKEKLEVSIKATNYREDKIEVNDNKTPYNLKLVPSKKHIFVSKRSGKYDVYKIDADGKNEEKVLPGSGIERDDIVLIPHPTDNVAAYISTRENVRDKDGYLLSTLTLINLDDNSVIKVAQSERIQVIDWIDDNLIYIKITSGASASDPQRHRLVSYNYKNDNNNELASSNYFNDVTIASGSIYYAPSASYQNPSNIGLFKIFADGKNKKTILDKEVWNIFRTEYDKLSLAVQQDWYEYKLGDEKAQKINGAPASPKTKVFIDSPNKEQSLWVDQRDGKGVLLAYSIASKIDRELNKQSSLNYPIRWLNNNTAVYRISNDQETADYVLNIEGGDPKKIIDVTNTGGVDKWYYY